MDFRNFNGIFIRSGKCIMWNSVQVFQNQASKSPSLRLKILNYESPMQSYIKHRGNSGSRLNSKVRSQYLLSSSEL